MFPKSEAYGSVCVIRLPLVLLSVEQVCMLHARGDGRMPWGLSYYECCRVFHLLFIGAIV